MEAGGEEAAREGEAPKREEAPRERKAAREKAPRERKTPKGEKGQDLRQSTQRGRRVAAPARSECDRRAEVAVLRAWLGRVERTSCRNPAEGYGPAGQHGVSGERRSQPVQRPQADAGELRADRARARRVGLRHRRRGLQGRRSRPAGTPWGAQHDAALGHRAQASRRTRLDDAGAHRHSGRPHRCAHPGGAAGAGDGRRRGGDERDAAQRGLHQWAGFGGARDPRRA